MFIPKCLVSSEQNAQRFSAGVERDANFTAVCLHLLQIQVTLEEAFLGLA